MSAGLSLDPRFSWVSECLQKAASDPSKQCDLETCPPLNAADVINGKLEFPCEPIAGEMRPAASLFSRIWKQEKGHVLLSMKFQFLVLIAQLSLPLVIHSFILSVECDNANRSREQIFFPILDDEEAQRRICGRTADGSVVEKSLDIRLFYYALGIFLCMLFTGVCNNLALHVAFNIGQRSRALVQALVFKKVFRLRQIADTGRILNLMVSDSQRFLETAPLFNQLYSAPLLVIISSVFLLKIVESSALIAIVGCLIMIPGNILITRFLLRARQSRVVCMDERMRLCSEILLGIRVVKYFAWEAAYVQRILDLRQRELVLARRELVAFAGTTIMTVALPLISMAGSLIHHSMVYGDLTPAKSFTMIVLAAIIRYILIKNDLFSLFSHVLNKFVFWF